MNENKIFYNIFENGIQNKDNNNINEFFRKRNEFYIKNNNEEDLIIEYQNNNINSISKLKDLVDFIFENILFDERINIKKKECKEMELFEIFFDNK